MPALLIRMSTRPQVRRAVSMIASPPLGTRHAVHVGDGLAALPPDLLGDGVRGLGIGAGSGHRSTGVVDHDACAAGSQQQRVLPAEAAARAGDHGHLIVEPQLSGHLTN